MMLHDFLEIWDLSTPILVLDKNSVIIEDNVVGEVTQRTLNQREILKAYYDYEKEKLVVTTTTYRKEFM